MLSIPTPIAHHPNSIEVIIAVITWILGWATIHNVTSPSILVLLAILPRLPFPRTDLPHPACRERMLFIGVDWTKSELIQCWLLYPGRCWMICPPHVDCRGCQ